MANYTLVGSSSVVQVLSPTVTEESVAATIKTQPTGIVATKLVSQDSFDKGTAGPYLSAFAYGIEAIISQGKAVGGAGTSALDSSGLQEYFVTFEVSYDPPGAPAGAVTVDVDVSVGLLDVEDGEIGQTLLGEAEAIIDKAYGNLVALAQG